MELHNLLGSSFDFQNVFLNLQSMFGGNFLFINSIVNTLWPLGAFGGNFLFSNVVHGLVEAFDGNFLLTNLVHELDL
jgi:hypothetical protein